MFCTLKSESQENRKRGRNGAEVGELLEYFGSHTKSLSLKVKEEEKKKNSTTFALVPGRGDLFERGSVNIIQQSRRTNHYLNKETHVNKLGR